MNIVAEFSFASSQNFVAENLRPIARVAPETSTEPRATSAALLWYSGSGQYMTSSRRMRTAVAPKPAMPLSQR